MLAAVDGAAAKMGRLGACDVLVACLRAALPSPGGM
jgi:hypothetical protein